MLTTIDDLNNSIHAYVLLFLTTKDLVRLTSVNNAWAKQLDLALRRRGISLHVLASIPKNLNVGSTLGPYFSFLLNDKLSKVNVQTSKVAVAVSLLTPTKVQYAAPVPSLVLASVDPSTMQPHNALEIRSMPKKKLLEISAQNLQNYNSIIECGKFDPASGMRILSEYNSFFGKEVDVYVALSDPNRRILYRASSIAEKFNYATNKVGMYLSRQRVQESQCFSGVSMGIYQATGFKGKPPGRTGLKCGGYFLTMSACIQFESHFCYGGKPSIIKQGVDETPLANSSIAETSGDSDSDKDKNLSRSSDESFEMQDSSPTRKRRSPEFGERLIDPLPQNLSNDKRRKIRIISNTPLTDTNSDDAGDENSSSSSDDNEPKAPSVSLREEDSHKSAFKSLSRRHASTNHPSYCQPLHIPCQPVSQQHVSHQPPVPLIANPFLQNPNPSSYPLLYLPNTHSQLHPIGHINSNLQMVIPQHIHTPPWNATSPVSPLQPMTSLVNLSPNMNNKFHSSALPMSFIMTPTSSFSRLSINQPIPVENIAINRHGC